MGCCCRRRRRKCRCRRTCRPCYCKHYEHKGSTCEGYGSYKHYHHHENEGMPYQHYMPHHKPMMKENHKIMGEESFY